MHDRAHQLTTQSWIAGHQIQRAPVLHQQRLVDQTVEDGQAVLNVGGGLVWDSRAELEYEEALWKSRFATPLPEPV